MFVLKSGLSARTESEEKVILGQIYHFFSWCMFKSHVACPGPHHHWLAALESVFVILFVLIFVIVFVFVFVIEKNEEGDAL